MLIKGDGIDKNEHGAVKISFDDYDKFTASTDLGTSAQDVLSPGWLYYALGLAGESGELMERIKKLFRDNGGVIDAEFKDLARKEMGDILWYMSRLSSALDFNLEQVAAANILKLASRMERGKLHGNGDNR